ncbi:hypothetical protein [Crateriforma conspicua]|uniref:Uncharacterized protein n=1 Tax=Crateriforma conspicua TaxID=2527996 RepID=A0A5C6FYV3_9PLAN|nr:hypothetical protein [Crateriforma conspicua]TWU66480.1 hypothetical protein V7x_20460 [Crateriforma conspicua]
MSTRMSLGQRYLMEALQVPKIHRDRLRKRVREGKCITIHEDGSECQNPVVSRGLCTLCKQHYYLARRKQEGEAAKIEFEKEKVNQGLILPQGTQADWTTKNPFLRDAS